MVHKYWKVCTHGGPISNHIDLNSKDAKIAN